MNAQVHTLAEAREMREAEFDRQREHIRETYGDNSVEAGAMRDQALAKLFYGSNWTQEKLAEKEGCSQTRMGQKLRFGAFLTFSTTVLIPKNLSERKFRGYWERTDKDVKKQERFREVVRLIEKDTRVSESTAPKRAVGQPLAQQFGDGKWHAASTMAKQLDVPESDVLAVLGTMHSRGSYGCHCEKKEVGTGWQYRIVRGGGKHVDLAVLTQELEPLLKQLEAEGRKNMATMSPTRVASLAHDLRTLIERLAK